MSRKVTNSAVLTFPISTQLSSESQRVTHFVLLDSATIGAGNVLGWGLLTTPSSLKDYVSLDTDTFYSPAHGFVDTNEVRLMRNTATGITNDIRYFIRDATTDTYKLAATSGGAAINITASGGGKIGLDKSLLVVRSAKPTFAAGDLQVELSGPDYVVIAILNALFQKTPVNLGAFATPPTIRVAFTTTAPVDTDTGATIAEATYSGYARLEALAGVWNAAA
jgi:hypothetical protein